MLNRLDDYPVHQTPVPVAHAGTSDANFYDRYFFNGWSRDGSLFLAAALGTYPNRRVMDASFCVVHEGRQHVLHASRLAPSERTETEVGPVHVEVEDAMRVLRVGVEPGDHGLRAELRFTAITDAVEEPRITRQDEGRLVMDSTRFTQFGSWSGELVVGGRRFEIDDDEHLGCRDRSWGIRPVGERPAAAAPGPPPQIYWVWAPLHLGEVCTLLGTFEDADGHAWHAHGAVAPTWASQVDAHREGSAEVRTLARAAHRIRFAPGTRRAASAEIELVPRPGGGETLRVELEPLLTFQMRGLGYLDPEWGHGMWKGELAVHAETWDLARLDPLDPRHVHVQQLVRARVGEREGTGVLEQLVIGPHAPSGFSGLLDGARGDGG